MPATLRESIENHHKQQINSVIGMFKSNNVSFNCVIFMLKNMLKYLKWEETLYEYSLIGRLNIICISYEHQELEQRFKCER